MSVSILVLSACSGDKAIDDPDIDCRDIDKSTRSALQDEHRDIAMPARSLYTGNEHEHVEAAVEEFEDIADVEWRIISAGVGLVRPATVLPAYDCTFSDDDSVRRRLEGFGYDPSELTRAQRIQAVAEELGIPSALGQRIANGVDLMFIVLGHDYLLATGSALSSIPDETTAFAFAAKGTRDSIGDCQWVPSTDTERKALGTTWMRVKGRQLRNVAQNVTAREDLADLRTGERIREVSIQGKTPE